MFTFISVRSADNANLGITRIHAYLLSRGGASRKERVTRMEINMEGIYANDP
ncbi:hypothetical protein K443DRAFT_677490 [Laccaria amethystina LaAM-08-1]|uniref:Uncharacterized protein n=1 Tax=Laccaria amethystina LaAM-08-1 TaxID=1095629 RepID=A0A0C9WTW3_9AGAR|nr:hypothetical protein K443DRAFT_677490 [Laccaria amethystina LaAM-08-1]